MRVVGIIFGMAACTAHASGPVALDTGAAVVATPAYEDSDEAGDSASGSLVKDDSDVGDTDTRLDAAAAQADLHAALDSSVPGLLYLSESESVVEVVIVPDGATPFPTAASIHGRLRDVWNASSGTAALADRYVERVDLSVFFDRLTVPQFYWTEFEQQQQAGWLAVRAVFEDGLAPAVVFRLGEHDLGGGRVAGSVEVYVLGATADGDLVGIHVTSIET